MSPLFTTELTLTMLGRDLLNALPPFASDVDVVTAAADAIGELASMGIGSMTAQFVSRHADAALEWLEHGADRDELKRTAAVRIFKHLAVHQTALFSSYIPRVLKVIFVVVVDPAPALRRAAVEALQRCLEVWRGRGLYPALYRDIENGFAQRKEETLHGCLLAAGAFVSATGDYIRETTYFASVCDVAQAHLTDRRELVVQSAMELLPRLALVDPDAFLRYRGAEQSKMRYMQQVLELLLRLMRKDRDRLCALRVLGELVHVIGPRFAPYAAETFKVVLEIAGAKARSSTSRQAARSPQIASEMEQATCSCIAKFVTAVGPEIVQFVPRLLELLDGLHVSDGLMRVHQAVADALPEVCRTVQHQVLNRMSNILQGRPFVHPGAPDAGLGADGGEGTASAVMLGRGVGAGSSAAGPTGGSGRRRGSAVEQAELVREELVALSVVALRTLAWFDFKGHSLTKFAGTCVLPLLRSEVPEVREAACTAIGALVVPLGADGQLDHARVDATAITETLMSLLTLGISDRKSHIRRAVLSSLSKPQVLPFLAKVKILRILFVCLYDEDTVSRPPSPARGEPPLTMHCRTPASWRLQSWAA